MENQLPDFDSFYSEKLLPKLKNLEPESNDTLKWQVAGIAALFLCIACFTISQSAIAILFVIVLIFSIFKFFRKKENFTYNYKEVIIKEIVEFLNPGALYEPLKMVAQRDYEYSGLYPRNYDDFSGEDWINGAYKDVNYFCSELETARLGGRHGGSRIRVFKGLFFVAPINFKYGATYVWPSNDVQLPATVADYHFERFLPLPEIAPVQMNNAEFESCYVVYSTDSSAARTIINSEMMERMIHFRNQINRDVRFSFVKGYCFVSIAMDENLFEPKLSDPYDKERVEEYFFSFLLILSIINQLRLNRLV